jgi:hypothetical protein
MRASIQVNDLAVDLDMTRGGKVEFGADDGNIAVGTPSKTCY